MYDLKNSGLALRTMKPKDLDQFAADLNHNFMSILNAAGFKGMPGASVTGPAGLGVRGSKWFFVANRISQFVSTYGLTGGDQITIAFLNTAMAANQIQLGTVIGLTTSQSFVEGDSIVLLSGQVIQLAMVTVGATTTPTWIDTGVTFQQTLGVTETRVIELINSMMGSPSDTDAIFRRFAAIAKNHSDASPGANTAVNTDSVLDIPTSDAGPGAVYADNYFIAAKEQAVGLLTKMCLLAGSPQQYHKLVQQTQEALTNNYAPGVDDFAAGIFLQNSYNNGIIMGHRDSSTIKEFARWYKTTTSAILTSHYSPNPADYSEIRMAKSELFLRGDLECRIETEHFINLGDKMTTKFFSYAGTKAIIADGPATHSLDIYAQAGIFLKHHISRQILSTDTTGKIVSIYTVIDNIASATSNTQLVGALAIQALYNTVTTHTTDLANLNKRAWMKRDWLTGTVDLNSLTEHGNYNIATGSTVNNFLPSFTTTGVDMHVNSIIMNTSDESLFTIMQEVTTSGPADGVFMSSSKWFRLGNKSANSAWTFSPWTINVTGADTVKATDGLNATGSFNHGNMKINHNIKTPTLVDSTNTNGKVIQNISYDAYGHPVTMQSTDFDGRYVKVQGPIYNVPYIGAPSIITLDAALTKMQKINGVKIIRTSWFDPVSAQGNNIWVTIPYMTVQPGGQAAYHNIEGHTVRYKRYVGGSAHSVYDIEILPIAGTPFVSVVGYDNHEAYAQVNRYHGPNKNNYTDPNVSDDTNASLTSQPTRIYGRETGGASPSGPPSQVSRWSITEFQGIFQNAQIQLQLHRINPISLHYILTNL